MITEKEHATLTESGLGELKLAGQVDYRNGKYLSEIGQSIIHQSKATAFTLDCSGVTRTSSVGVSLILSLIREAKQTGRSLTIKALTTDLEEIARFSDLKDVLPLSADYQVIG